MENKLATIIAGSFRGTSGRLRQCGKFGCMILMYKKNCCLYNFIINATCYPECPRLVSDQREPELLYLFEKAFLNLMGAACGLCRWSETRRRRSKVEELACGWMGNTHSGGNQKNRPSNSLLLDYDIFLCKNTECPLSL